MNGPSGSGEPGVGRPGSVVEAHAVLTSRRQVLDDRRALYQLAVQMAAGRDAGHPAAVLDHPISRFRIGEVIAGRLPADRLELIDPRDVAEGGAHRDTVVAGDPGSPELLAPALRSVAAEAGLAGSSLGLLTRADGERFRSAVGDVRAGLRLARELVPELMEDIEPHIALIGVLDPHRSGTVVSASSRHVPGLVLLRPGGALDVAESLVHEGAHQRLFDLAITRDLLRAEADRRPGFRPSWRHVVWPVEQTLAAFHAYACLSELAGAVPVAGQDRVAWRDSAVGPHSVLPEAPERAAEIGSWLGDHPDLLGADAVRLVAALLGRPMTTPAPAPGGAGTLRSGPAFRAEDCRAVPAADGRCLVGLPGPAPRLFWLDTDAAAVLQILREDGPVDVRRIVREFAARPGTGDAFGRVAGALDTLVLAELAVAGGC